MASRSVGRPEIGPAFTVRFTNQLLVAIDDAADAAHTSRAAWLRSAAEEQLAYPRKAIAALAAWLATEGQGWDAQYVIERIDKHADLLYCALNRVPGNTYDTLSRQRALTDEMADNLPPGWTYRHTTPIDFAVTCPHGVNVHDTFEHRQTTPPQTCLDGCSHLYWNELSMDLAGQPEPFPSVTQSPKPAAADARNAAARNTDTRDAEIRPFRARTHTTQPTSRRPNRRRPVT